MKVGDMVRSTKRHGVFKIFESIVTTTLDHEDKPVARVSYLAMDENTNKVLKFFGYDVNKTVFKVSSSEQLKLF